MITPLRCGVDTLEATFAGELSEEIVTELKRRKEDAIAHCVPNELLLGGKVFYLSPKGGGFWPYMLRNDEMIIQLGTAKNIPAMKVHLLSRGLAEVGVQKLWAQARQIAEELGLTFLNCTRLDVALDYQGDFFTFEEMLNVVCPSPFRPVYPNTVDPETFQFGKGDMVLRNYNKSAEIEANNKQWWKFVWRLYEGYVEGQPVYRIEVQMRGKVLRELGFHSVEQLIDSLPELFAYGLEWCSLRVPTADSNKSRWPEDLRWTALRTAFNPSRSLGRLRPAQAIIEYDKAVKRMVSLLSYAGVAVGSTDYWHLVRALTTDAEQLIEREMDTSFEALVEKKRKQRYL